MNNGAIGYSEYTKKEQNKDNFLYFQRVYLH